MPTPLPNLGASRQLQKLGGLAKSVGPGLFAPTQAPRPASPALTSMMADTGSLNLPSMMGGLNALPGSPFGGIGMPSMMQPNFGQGMGQPSGMGPGGQPTYGGGSIGSLGGEFAVLDQYDQYFQEAAAATGMPVNVLKAIAAVERGWEGTSVAGAQGIMQVMPFWGQDFGLNLQDPRQNILAGAKVLKSGMDQYGNMDMAIRSYLGFGTDAYGTTDQGYLQRVKQYQQQLDSSGGSFGGGSTGGTGNISGMFGPGASVEGWGEFNVPSGNGLYGYGTSYGLNGSSHTGLDVAMPVGTPMYAPMGGVVTCAGTNNGSGADGGGCAAFGDTYGQGAGRIEILLDNGTVLIYGHSSTAAVRPGQRVNGGALLGTSGGMNSPHTHLEARVRDGGTGSGWRIVDPRTVLGGGMFTGGASAGTPYGGTNYGGGTSYSLNQAIANFLRGWGR